VNFEDPEVEGLWCLQVFLQCLHPGDVKRSRWRRRRMGFLADGYVSLLWILKCPSHPVGVGQRIPS